MTLSCFQKKCITQENRPLVFGFSGVSDFFRNFAYNHNEQVGFRAGLGYGGYSGTSGMPG
jgi:hypothetical protein